MNHDQPHPRDFKADLKEPDFAMSRVVIQVAPSPTTSWNKDIFAKVNLKIRGRRDYSTFDEGGTKREEGRPVGRINSNWTNLSVIPARIVFWFLFSKSIPIRLLSPHSNKRHLNRTIWMSFHWTAVGRRKAKESKKLKVTPWFAMSDNQIKAKIWTFG